MAQCRMVTVDATPGPLKVDLSATAILVVEMQNDFGAVDGMFDRAGIDIFVIRRAIAPTARVIAAARVIRLPVVYVREEHRPDLSDIGAEGSPHWRMCQRMAVGAEVTAPDGRPSRIHVADTWNTEILTELTPEDGDIIVTKRRYSAFYGTELDARLRTLGIRYLVVTGCTTSICIESTIRDAAFRDHICVLPVDCTGQPTRSGSSYSGHEESLKIIERTFGERVKRRAGLADHQHLLRDRGPSEADPRQECQLHSNHGSRDLWISHPPLHRSSVAEPTAEAPIKGPQHIQTLIHSKMPDGDASDAPLPR